MSLNRGEDELGRWPSDSKMELIFFGENLKVMNWLI